MLKRIKCSNPQCHNEPLEETSVRTGGFCTPCFNKIANSRFTRRTSHSSIQPNQKTEVHADYAYSVVVKVATPPVTAEQLSVLRRVGFELGNVPITTLRDALNRGESLKFGSFWMPQAGKARDRLRACGFEAEIVDA